MESFKYEYNFLLEAERNCRYEEYERRLIGHAAQYMKYHAQVIFQDHTDFTNGHIRCFCGWEKRVGAGFGKYLIAECPGCNKKIGKVYNRTWVWDYTKCRNQYASSQNESFRLSNGVIILL